MPQLFIAMLVTLLLVGCSQFGYVKPDPNSRLYLPPVGTLIELKKPLTVVPGRARVFLQRGKSAQGIDQYAPNCNFEVRQLSEQPQIISPEQFLVVRVQRVTEQVVQSSEPLQLASRRYIGLIDSGHPMITRGVHLWIGSDIQPNVMRMTCRGGFDDPWRADLPSINEMREALGSFAVITLP